MNALGKLSLILSLLCFLFTLGFKLALSGWIPFISVGFWFGLFFLLFALAINLQFLRSLLKSESLRFLGKSLLLLLASFAVVFFVNFIFYKKNLTVDITDNKIHSLSELSQALVKALPEPLYFYYFHVGNSKVRGFEPQVRAALEPYLALSSKLHFQSYSIFQRPDLAEKFKVGDEESSLFIEHRGRIQRLSGLDEASITNGILKVSKEAKRIYFLQSHDERKIEDNSTFGLKGMKEQLERLHYEIASLTNFDSVPEDIAILVMAGPRVRVSEADQSKIRDYILAGGALLVAIDPGEDHGLGPLLKSFGVEAQDVFLFTPEAQASQSNLLVLTHAGQSSHEVALGLAPGLNPALFISSSLQVLEQEGVKVSPVLEHLPNSVARSDIDPASSVVKSHSLFAALLSEGLNEGNNYFRVATVADSDFMTNQFFSRPGNFDFILSLVTFLSKDEDLLKMQSPVPETTYLILTQTQLNLYFLFFVLPMCVLFFLVALFFKLRKLF